MINKWANFISVICHPIWINAIALWSLLLLHPFMHAGLNNSVKLFYFGFIFISCSIVPLVVVLLGKFFGYSSNILLPNSEDRHIPYLVTAAMLVFNFYLMKKIGAPYPLQSYLLASASIMIVIIIINFNTKISAHATALGAWVGLIIALGKLSFIDVRWLLIASILISGLTLAARLQLNAHTKSQVYSGFLIGLGIMFLLGV